MKLFLVKLHKNYSQYGTSYVVAENSDEAVKKVQKYLNEKDLCYVTQREMDTAMLLADTKDYSDIGTMLYL